MRADLLIHRLESAIRELDEASRICDSIPEERLGPRVKTITVPMSRDLRDLCSRLDGLKGLL